MTIAVSHPGKLGDLLYCLPTVRHIAKISGQKVDFWTSKFCQAGQTLLDAQPYINKCFISDKYVMQHEGCGVQPWLLQPDKSYDRVYHLGLRDYPQCRLVDYYPKIYGFSLVDTTISYEFEKIKEGDKIGYLNNPECPPIVICPGRNPNLKGIFNSLINSLIDDHKTVYQVGPKDECITTCNPNVITYNVDMLNTLALLEHAKLFIGTLSANLVLANGFSGLKKVVLCEPERWNPRHDIHSEKHIYLVPSSVEQILKVL